MKSIRCIRWVLKLSLVVLTAACGGGSEDAGRASPTAAVAPDKTRAAAQPLAAGPLLPFTANGWYWNPNEGGTGFMFEAQGSRAFVGFFMYEQGTGNPIWYAASGDITNGALAGDHLFVGDLRVYHGGMALSARSWTEPTSRSLGMVGISFIGGKAIVSFPGGRTMNAERFCAGGHCEANPPLSTIAETGWYWNPAEGGRGVAVETHADRRFIGIFHYNPDGSPVWHVVTSSGRLYERLEMYTGGQSLTSAYRSPALDVVIGFLLPFRSPCAGQMQIPGVPAVSLQRFVIDGTRPAASACNALPGLVDVADISQSMDIGAHAGEAVFGVIDSAADADGYKIYLDGIDETYTFDLLGAASNSGSLNNPLLSLYDSNLALVAENDDRDATTTDSRIGYTIPRPGFYTLRVRSSVANAGPGSFLLKISGLDPLLRKTPLLPAADYQGAIHGKLRGVTPAHVSLTMGGDGSLSGIVDFVGQPGQRVRVTGTVAAGGRLDFSGFRSVTGTINCNATIAADGLLGGCGDAGMLTGSFLARPGGAFGPMTLPASAVVGQPVAMSASALPGPFATTYEWTFGDGSLGQGAVPPAHVYSTPGIVSVGLRRVGGASPDAVVDSPAAQLLVLCADGTLCTDFDEAPSSVVIDSADCVLRDMLEGIHPVGHAKAPLLRFAGRAKVSSDHRIVAFVAGNRRTSEEQYLRSLALFGFWDMQRLSVACEGRDPCTSGPFTSFTDSPLYRSAKFAQLHQLWETRSLLSPQPAWLYVGVFDKTYTRLVAWGEKSLTCPGYVPMAVPTSP